MTDQNPLNSAVVAMTEEADALYSAISGLSPEQYSMETPFAGWTIHDMIGHFVTVDGYARAGMSDVPAFELARDALINASSAPTLDNNSAYAEFEKVISHERVLLAGQGTEQLIAAWRDGLSKLCTLALDEKEDRRIGWFGPPMAISRLLNARQMELWCYGQDIYDAFRLKRENTDRIKNVAEFGMRTRRFSFAANGLDAPDAPHIELVAPSGEFWTWNEKNGVDSVRGTAEEFCLVVTQRRNIRDTAIKTEGAGAAQWMEIAQCIAGGPYTPPAPGQRVW